MRQDINSAAPARYTGRSHPGRDRFPSTWVRACATATSAVFGGNQIQLWAGVRDVSVYEAAVDLCHRLGVDVPWIQRRGSNNREAHKRKINPRAPVDPFRGTGVRRDGWSAFEVKSPVGERAPTGGLGGGESGAARRVVRLVRRAGGRATIAS